MDSVSPTCFGLGKAVCARDRIRRAPLCGGMEMSDTQAPTEVVILSDQANNHYAFSREQLADALVSDESVADLNVISQTVAFSAALNKRPGGRW